MLVVPQVMLVFLLPVVDHQVHPNWQSSNTPTMASVHSKILVSINLSSYKLPTAKLMKVYTTCIYEVTDIISHTLHLVLQESILIFINDT